MKPSNQTIPPSISKLSNIIGRAIGNSVEAVAVALVDLLEVSPLLARRVDEIRAERRTAREQVALVEVFNQTRAAESGKRTTLEKFAREPGHVVELVDPRKVN